MLLSCPIYTRDDAFDMLRSIYKDADRAFLDAENMRKGKFCDGRCEFDPAAPDAVRDLAQHIAYLFPRVHIQWYALQYYAPRQVFEAGPPRILQGHAFARVSG